MSAQLLTQLDGALAAAERYAEEVRAGLAGALSKSGRLDPVLLEANQFAAHGYAWVATTVAALKELRDWCRRLEAAGQLGEIERLIAGAGFGEYLAQLQGGIAMSQGEVVRPPDLGAEGAAARLAANGSVRALLAQGNTLDARIAIAVAAADGRFGVQGLADETLEMVREPFRRIATETAEPFHRWHLKDELIPLELIGRLAELGVFGMTVPEEYGGAGLGKLAMVVVTEELSRGALGIGSLATRSEIAAELIRLGGTEEQKQKWLPKIASGEILPTAVFTEPDTGSDLGALKTRAVRDGDVYRVTGNKTWITHAARADVMTLLARTDPNSKDWRGLSMFIVEKPRGTAEDPFPVPGMRGGEIPVLGYRGMKEYEIGFDDFRVPADALLGGTEGQGFKQLMATFESARIQTAARAVGVAQNALELAIAYATSRKQFGKPIAQFPRVFGKIAAMAVETMAARQLTFAAARAKDSGRRCDIEAGMAKLLAARVAWANADLAVQIHGGNGYAMEFPISRVLVDARILNIFEGAAEIQAQVIARGLLSGERN
ncbi:MAG: Acyl-CoA dehydrogenase [Rhodospirillales bacterium]|jgi:(2S)-methylsuccinyl-CoA dehydrogenase|nr:Acyl-CoA dehydrogenase [Rhodospirillales bacterium]